LPFIQVVRSAFRVDEQDSRGEIARKLRRGLELLGVAIDTALPFLLNLLGLDAGKDAFRGLDGEIIGARTREVLEELLRERCRLSPVVLAIDDLHWSDSASEELLLRIVQRSKQLPLLMVCAFRPEFRVPWAGHPGVVELPLKPLSDDGCIQLVQRRLGVDSLPEELTRLIVEKAEGNPLFAEELTRYLMDSGGLLRTQEGLSFRAAETGLSAPGSVQDLVMARVDRLPESARAVLQVAAVIGRRFSPELMRAATDVNGHLPDYVRVLESQELIFRQATHGGEEYIFKHALVQEAVYESLLTGRRKALHQRVAEAIERSYGDRLAEWAEVLAHHWGQTPHADKAVRYLALAGEKSLRIYSVEEAHERFRRIVELIEAHPSCADDRFLADVLLAWSRAHYYRKDVRGLIALERYLPRVEALGVTRRLSLFLFWLGFAHLFPPHPDKARALLEKALALGEALSDDECIGYACMGLTFLHVLKYGETAIELASRGIEIADRLGDVYLMSKCLLGLFNYYAFGGRYQRAREVALRARDLARRAGDPRAMALALGELATVDIYEERFADAVENAGEGLRISPDPLDRAGMRVLKGLGLALTGQPAEGVAMARDGIEDLRAANAGEVSAWFEIALGVALVVSGQIAGGVRWIQETVRRAIEVGRIYLPAGGHLVLGEIYLEMVRGEKKTPLPVLVRNAGFILRALPFARRLARRHLEEAVRWARETDQPGVLARALFDLGMLATASRRFEEARRHLEEAHRLAEPYSTTLTEKIHQALAPHPRAR
jgi:tetratricopeptide (TPR) repeat protein